MNNSSLNLQSNQVQNAQYVTHQKTSKNQSQPTFNGNEPKQDGDKKLRTALIGLGIAGAAAAGIAIAVKTGKAGKIINACKDKVDDVAGSVSKKAGQAAESATTATTKAANAMEDAVKKVSSNTESIIPLNKKKIPTSLVIDSNSNKSVSLKDLKFEEGIAMEKGKPFSGNLLFTANGDNIKIEYTNGYWTKTNIQKSSGNYILKERHLSQNGSILSIDSYSLDKNLDPISSDFIVYSKNKPLRSLHRIFQPDEAAKDALGFDDSKVKLVREYSKRYSYDGNMKLTKIS